MAQVSPAGVSTISMGLISRASVTRSLMLGSEWQHGTRAISTRALAPRATWQHNGSRRTLNGASTQAFRDGRRGTAMTPLFVESFSQRLIVGLRTLNAFQDLFSHRWGAIGVSVTGRASRRRVRALINGSEAVPLPPTFGARASDPPCRRSCTRTCVIGRELHLRKALSRRVWLHATLQLDEELNQAAPHPTLAALLIGDAAHLARSAIPSTSWQGIILRKVLIFRHQEDSGLSCIFLV